MDPEALTSHAIQSSVNPGDFEHEYEGKPAVLRREQVSQNLDLVIAGGCDGFAWHYAGAIVTRSSAVLDAIKIDPVMQWGAAVDSDEAIERLESTLRERELL